MGRTSQTQYAPATPTPAKVPLSETRFSYWCDSLAVLASACTVFSVDEGATASPPTSTSTTQISTTSTGEPLPTTTSTISLGDPKAIVSPSGVAVAVRQTLTDGHLITTPCGNEVTPIGGTPVYSVTVVLDPGHGGPIDTGAGSATGTPEKDVNLRVAKATEALLLDLGIPTLMTRSDDYATPLSLRAHLADAVEATLMVSIHHNAPTHQPSTFSGHRGIHSVLLRRISKTWRIALRPRDDQS